MEKKSFISRIGGMAFGLIYIALGILVMNNPNTTLASISFAFGWFMTIAGALLLISVITGKLLYGDRHMTLVEAILVALLGLIFLFGNFKQDTVFLSYLLIFWIIIDSALQLQFIQVIEIPWVRILSIIINVFVLVYCVYMLFHPSQAESFLVFVIAIGFIGTGFGKLVHSFS